MKTLQKQASRKVIQLQLMFLRKVYIFDRNLGRELTEPSEISNEIEAMSQRLSEQNNTKKTQIEQHLNSKIEEILKEIRTNRHSNLVSDEKDVENSRPSTSNSENKLLRRKYARKLKLTKTKIRIIASSPRKCMN